MKKHIPLIIGNWKLFPNKVADAEALSTAVAKLHKKKEAPYVAIAPSPVHMTAVSKKIARCAVHLAAQAASPHPGGAYTGTISAAQLRDLDTTFVLVGHSERRDAGVTDSVVTETVQEVFKQKMTPVVCVGEQKRDTSGKFFTHIEQQILVVTNSLTTTQIKKMVIAYEPIWAIGTGNTATAEDVQEMQLFIRKVLTKKYDRTVADAVRLLYGGSVKPHNAALLHTVGGMNGFLVGGASHKAADFIAISRAVV